MKKRKRKDLDHLSIYENLVVPLIFLVVVVAILRCNREHYRWWEVSDSKGNSSGSPARTRTRFVLEYYSLPLLGGVKLGTDGEAK